MGDRRGQGFPDWGMATSWGPTVARGGAGSRTLFGGRRRTKHCGTGGPVGRLEVVEVVEVVEVAGSGGFVSFLRVRRSSAFALCSLDLEQEVRSYIRYGRTSRIFSFFLVTRFYIKHQNDLEASLQKQGNIFKLNLHRHTILFIGTI